MVRYDRDKMKRVYFRRGIRLAVHVNHFDSILMANRCPDHFAQVSRWCCTGLLLDALQIGLQGRVVHTDLAGGGKFNRAKRCTRSKSGGRRCVESARGTVEPKLKPGTVWKFNNS